MKPGWFLSARPHGEAWDRGYSSICLDIFGGRGCHTEAAGGSLTSQEIMKDVYFPFNLFSTRRGPWGKGDSPPLQLLSAAFCSAEVATQRKPGASQQ